MPLYTYECPRCEVAVDRVIKYEERDNGQFECETCGSTLRRRGVSEFCMGKPAYQMQAVLGNGDHIKGHFGKDAKRRKRRET